MAAWWCRRLSDPHRRTPTPPRSRAPQEVESMSQSYVDVSAMAGGLATATGALFTLVFAGVLSGKPDRVFRNLQDKRNQKVCLNMVAVSAEAFIAMMCWIGVRSTDGQALKAVLAVPAAAVTVLAFSQLVQSVVLRM